MLEVAQRYRTRFEGAFRHFTVPGAYSPDAAAAGRRALRNAALAYIMAIDDSTARALTFLEFRRAENMTDAMAALGLPRELGGRGARPRARDVPRQVEGRGARGRQVVPRAGDLGPARGGSRASRRCSRTRPSTCATPTAPAPSCTRSRWTIPLHFHAADGSGYALVAEGSSSSTASTRRSPRGWRAPSTAGASSTPAARRHARAALESIAEARRRLSADVAEVVSRALA